MANGEPVVFLYVAGFVLILSGILLLVMNMYRQKGEAHREFGGVVLIGPFPIIFGSSRRMMKVMLVIAFVFVTLFLLMFLWPYLFGAL